MDAGDVKILNDEAIVTSVVNDGNHKMFKVLYDRYHGKVLNKCYSMIKNREIADDLTQEIFSRVYEKLPSFKGNSSFSSWIYAITYNNCIDYLRNKKKLHYPEWNKKNEIPEIIDEIDETGTDIDYDKFLQILEKIHPEEKALVLMKYQDNISIKNIAEALRITESATKMRLKRARARILFIYKNTYKKF